MDAPKRVVQPSIEPVTVSEAKTHLRIDNNVEDAYIASLISVARITAENRTQRTFITTTWSYTLDSFPDAIPLPNPPIIDAVSLQYISVDNVLVTLSSQDYVVDNVREPGWIVPKYGKQFPPTYDEINSVIATYRAGYGSLATDVPAPIRHWILLAVGDLYDQSRSLSSEKNIIPSNFVNSLLDPYSFFSP